MALFAQQARREALKARIALDGPTGSGKTWTALQTARILAGPYHKVAVIDTENRSAAFYAPAEPVAVDDRVNWYDPPYEFFHLPVSPPYDPRELTNLIEAAGKELSPDDVLVIDSLSHYWEGEGGTLDQVDHAASRNHGNSFAGWREGTPMQRHMIDTIVHAPFHVVVTMRSKMEYVVEETTDKNGRRISRPVKIGLAPVQRNGVEYEFTVVGDLDLEHRLTISKSRCADVADAVYTSGRSAEFGAALASWLKNGVPPITDEQVQVITSRLNSISDTTRRQDVKIAFLRAFGKPDQLYSDAVDGALAWIDERIPPSDDDDDTTTLEPGTVELLDELTQAVKETRTSAKATNAKAKTG